jgi:NAD(P)-dependent dehydrogenase (short-subunit alcohol dehydrogenase family)
MTPLPDGTLAGLKQHIVTEIIADLSDRRGLRHQWDQIDEDIQQQIREEWEEIVATNLAAHFNKLRELVEKWREQAKLGRHLSTSGLVSTGLYEHRAEAKDECADALEAALAALEGSKNANR